MDDLDLKIYRSLIVDPASFKAFTNVRKTNLAIARELGVDEGTIRNRLNRMIGGGFIKGRHVYANPSMLGKLDVHLGLDMRPPSHKADVIRKTKLIDGVYLVRDYLNNAMGVDFVCDDEESLARKVELISRIANAEEVIRFVARPGPERFFFTDADARIIWSIRESPRKPFKRIAKEANMSVKSVKRRFDRMVEAGALLVANVLDYKKAKGVIMGNLVVSFDETHDRGKLDQELLRVLGDRVRVHMMEHESASFSLMFRNVSEQREMLMAVKTIEGINKARLDIVVDNVYVYEALDDLARRAPEIRNTAGYVMHRLG